MIFFYSGGSKTLAQFAQRGGGCPFPGIIQGQVEGLSATWSSRRYPCSWQDIGLDDLQRIFQLKFFYDFMIL